jgi:exodeoxyribonuclease VII small subunit
MVDFSWIHRPRPSQTQGVPPESSLIAKYIMPANDPPKPDQDQAPERFEDALEDLQEIVGRLEDGSLGLDESMRQFERGVRLLRQCYEVLDRAEQRIEILTRIDENGRPVTEPFDATATAETSQSAAGRRKRAKRSERPDPDDDAGALF